jgi:iron complex transport system substrate-binding protein
MQGRKPFNTMFRKLSLLVAGLMLLGTRGAEAQGVTITGADGVRVQINDASRIVTLSSAVTETVFALGLADQVVGVDESSTFPAEAAARPKVGFYRQASSEGILSLKPTLVLAPESINPATVVQQLRAAGVPVLLLEEAQSAEAARERIRTIGQALKAEAGAEAVISRMDRDLAEAERIQRSGRAPKVLFIYARGAGTVNVAGNATAADAVLRLAGGENVVSGYEGYRPLTAEAAVAAAPEIIVIPADGLESLGNHTGLLRQPGISLTPAGRNHRIVAVDDLLLLGFGPRLGEGVLALTRALYGSASSTTAPR